MAKTVLLVDDDPLLRKLLEGLLRRDGYFVQSAANTQEALRAAKRHPPDAAIVDVDLGQGESGLSLLGLWRVQDEFPVMVLSGRGEAADRITGLELGALDYLAKPFEPRELLLRLRLVLERSPAGQRASAAPPEAWRLGELVFDAARRRLGRQEDGIALSTLEFRLLDYLVHRANKVVTREQILDAVHQRDKQVNDRAVDVLIGRLRKKLVGSQVSLQAVRGAGYMLCGQVDRL